MTTKQQKRKYRFTGPSKWRISSTNPRNRWRWVRTPVGSVRVTLYLASDGLYRVYCKGGGLNLADREGFLTQREAASRAWDLLERFRGSLGV